MSFVMYSHAGYGKFLGERDTIEEAERFARWHTARRGECVEICRMVKAAVGMHPQTVAIVSQESKM